jgi:hypothetical protein
VNFEQRRELITEELVKNEDYKELIAVMAILVSVSCVLAAYVSVLHLVTAVCSDLIHENVFVSESEVPITAVPTGADLYSIEGTLKIPRMLGDRKRIRIV